MLPPIPSWEGLHPLLVHFPIALLLVVPVFLVGGLMFKKLRAGAAIAALVLMLMGTTGAFLSVATGEAAGELAERNVAVNEALEEHEELAEDSQWVFAGLTAVFAVLVIVPRFLKRPLPAGLVVGGHVVFLVVYLGGTVLLANTAHAGGRLVHEFGVHSLVADTPAAAVSDHDDRRGRD